MVIRILIWPIILLIPAAAVAEIVLYDHFDDGVLDPNWEVVLNDIACGWTYTEEVSDLRVTDICHAGDAGDWAVVSLIRPCPCTGDFYVAWRFAWDSHNLPLTRQVIYLLLHDEAGNWIAYTGHHDAWVAWKGEKVASVRDAEPYHSGYNTLPYADSATITVNRIGEVITCKWDGEVLLTAPQSLPVATLEIRFYYTWAGAGETHIDESVDFVRVADDVATAVPGASDGAGAILTGICPNPFNPQTTITFAVPSTQRATVGVYDLSGRRLEVLADRTFAAGSHSVVWNGRDTSGRGAPSGTYVVRLNAESASVTTKVVLLR